MSGATATLIASGLAVVGTLMGVVVGLALQHWQRRSGEVRMESGPQWNRSSDGSAMVAMRFFNDRDVNISLWDANVEFYTGAEFIGTVIPTMRRRLVDGTAGDKLEPLDLESRKSMYLVVEVEFGYREEVNSEQASGADRVEFVATKIPGRRKVRASLPLWDETYP